jgi:hypothetical protein
MRIIKGAQNTKPQILISLSTDIAHFCPVKSADADA